MRILFIQKSTDRGGAKNSLFESLRIIIQDQSIEPIVLVGEPGPFTGRCVDLGIQVPLADLPEWRKWRDRLRFSKAMRQAAGQFSAWNVDWVISNEMWWGPQAARIAKHLGCRSAVILRDGIATIPKALKYRLFENDLILPVSTTICEALAPHPALGPRVHVLFNSVSLPPADPADEIALDSLLSPFPDVRHWLLVVGRLSSRKNQADAVRVLRSLIDDGHTDLGLLLAGDIDSEYTAEMDAVIAETKLAGRVAMIGHFEGIPTLLERAQTVLLPSFREGLPRSLVESILAGKPAFSYPCEGVDDIYGEHRNTFVSGKFTAAALHQSIRSAWTAPESTAAAFDAVRKNVFDRFSPEAHIARLKSLLGVQA